VPMDVLHCSGRILDGEHQHLSSGHVSESRLHDGDHNRLRWFGVHSRCELCATRKQAPLQEGEGMTWLTLLD
jgi:hypothetical protein